jgi:hypothetical protein
VLSSSPHLGASDTHNTWTTTRGLPQLFIAAGTGVTDRRFNVALSVSRHVGCCIPQARPIARSGAISRARPTVGGLCWLLGLLDGSRPLEPRHDARRFRRGCSHVDKHHGRDPRRPVQSRRAVGAGGVLGGYSGLTRDAYTLDLRQYVAWCTEHRVAVFGARRADIECFARHLEALGRARATIARRLCTVSCFYRYAEQEGLIAVSPAAHLRRPRLARSPTPPGWTATRSGPCWSPPDSPAPAITR